MKNCVSFLLCCLIYTSHAQVSSILPTPVTYVQREGNFQINQALKVNPSEINPSLFTQLKELGTIYHQLRIEPNVQNAMLQFKKMENVKQDSYSITHAIDEAQRKWTLSAKMFRERFSELSVARTAFGRIPSFFHGGRNQTLH